MAWVDASVGIAGDMLLGALIDAGADLVVVQTCIDAVIPGTVRLHATGTSRAGMRATKVEVALVALDQEHRRWTEIRERLTAARLPSRTRQWALAVFGALAEVEARAHGVGVEQVHFHEVGAWDSIADIVGVCAALEDLGVDEVVVSRIGVGSGTTVAAHGRMPVPVPAVLGLLTGWAIDAVGEGELATPTGAALASTLASRQGPIPAMRIIGTGVGAGAKDVPGRANVVRVVLGRTLESPSGASGPRSGLDESSMTVLEANVDDLDPRVWPSVLGSLLEEGAADAWLTPITMKRGRPAHVLSVLVHDVDAGRLRDLVLTTTSTIGVRATSVRRWALPRGWVSASVEGQRVRLKVAHRAGLVVHATPEFRDVEAAARALTRPVRDLLEAAVAVAEGLGLTPGAPVPSLDAEFEPHSDVDPDSDPDSDSDVDPDSDPERPSR